VPQLYLRGFTNASGRMFCYDKVTGRSHPTTTKAAAQEPYFYEFAPAPGLSVPVNTVEKTVEKAFCGRGAELGRSLAAVSRALGLRRHRAGFFVLFSASWNSFSKAVSIAFSPGLPAHL
jgi:hypothetical protein